jgi:RNA polymerase sigma-70 factor (ECF subfamily)
MTRIADRVYRGLLVVRCQAGDALAFAELVAFFHPRLCCYLRQSFPELRAAEDLLQDVWLDVHRGIGRLSDPGAFAGWLYQIARRRALRELRRRRPAPDPLEGRDIADIPDSADSTPEDVEAVRAALDELVPEHREVLLLRYAEELPYEEISRVTGCPLGTVRSRLHYARQALRRALERTKCHE